MDKEQSSTDEATNQKSEDVEALLETAQVMAEGYRHSAPLAMKLIKQTLAREPVTLEAIFAYEAEVQIVLGDSEDSIEAKAAFFEKRLPNFRSK